MNSKRNIVVAAVLFVAAIVLTTSWNVVTGDSNDPNEVDIRGIWTARQPRGLASQEQMAWIQVIGEEKNGTSTLAMTILNPDPTVFGMFPEATTRSDSVGMFLRTGPDTWDFTLISYGMTGVHESGYSDLVWIQVDRGTATATDSNTILATGRAEIYSARDYPNHPRFGNIHDQDTNPRDGFPDTDEEPIFSGDYVLTQSRMPMLEPPGAGL